MTANDWKVGPPYPRSFSATALTSHSLQDAEQGRIRIILISPESALSSRLLAKPSFQALVFALVIDEVHCISIWGGEFRRAYGQLGKLRHRLGSHLVVGGLTATVTTRAKSKIIQVLDMTKSTSFVLHESNDRPDIFLEVRAMKHTALSCRDLFFLLPSTPVITSFATIPLSIIFCDTTTTCQLVVHELEAEIRRRWPDSYALHGGDGSAVTYYHAIMTSGYLATTLKAFRDGRLRILVATEVAGMGLDIPNIEVVVQWTFSVASPTTLLQRIGRAARMDALLARAVFLVHHKIIETAGARVKQLEKAVIADTQRMEVEAHEESEPARDGAGIWEDEPEPAADQEEQEQGKEKKKKAGRGNKRSSQRSNYDLLGLYRLLAETSCRRANLDALFGNNPCCEHLPSFPLLGQRPDCHA